MAERLPVYKQRGVQIDPYRAADFSPLLRETRNLQQVQSRALDRVIDYATQVGKEQAIQEGRQSVTDVEQAKVILGQVKEKGMPFSAFDRAAYDQANEVLALELDNQGRAMFSQKIKQYKQDPNADPINFLAETGDIALGFDSLTSLLDPKLRAKTAAGLQRARDTAFLEISETYNDRVAKEVQAKGIAGIAQRRDDISRLGASNKIGAENDLFLEIQDIRTFARASQIGAIEAEKQVIGAIEDFHIQRIRKEFAKAPDKAAFLKNLQADLSSGPIGDLFDEKGNPTKTDRLSRGIDPAKVTALTNEFEADLRAQDAQVRALRTEIKGDITETMRIFSLGAVPDQSVVSDIQRRVTSLGGAADPDLVAQANYLGVLRQQSIAFSKMNSAQLGDWIRNAEQQTANGANLQQAMLIDVARKSLSSLTNDLEKDPVARMNRTGFAPVKTLDFTAQPDQLMSQIKERVTQSRAFAETQGLAVPRFLSNDEAALMSSFLDKAPIDNQIAFLGTINQGFGKDTGLVLSEMSKFAPEFAHVAGLSTVGASKSTLVDALNGIKLSKEGVKTFEGSGDAATKKAQLADQLGGAYIYAPKTRQAIVKTADAIYLSRSIGMDKTVFDGELYKQAFQEASGAVMYKDGKLRGGIIEHRGVKMAIPNNIPQNDFSSILDKATLEDFAAATGVTPQDEKGRAYTVDRLRKAYLVSRDDSTAIMYYENPTDKSNPVAFGGANGEQLIINLRVLADRVTQRTKR
jgi:hypothetical protein